MRVNPEEMTDEDYVRLVDAVKNWTTDAGAYGLVCTVELDITKIERADVEKLAEQCRKVLAHP